LLKISVWSTMMTCINTSPPQLEPWNMSPDLAFARCPACGRTWPDRNTFINSTDYEVIGYDADFHDPRAGKLRLVHSSSLCGELFTVPIDGLWSVLEDPQHAHLMQHGPCCPRKCDNPADMGYCGNTCKMSHARTLVAVVRELSVRRDRSA
jgi:hypothetical protein